MQAGILNEWRRVTKVLKFERLMTMRRVMRVLRVAVKRRKQLGKMALSALAFKKTTNQNLLKLCFHAMRQICKEEKLEKEKLYHDEDMRPVVDLLTFQVNGLSELHKINDRTKAVKAVMWMSKRKLAFYLQQWKERAEIETTVKKKDFSGLLTKLMYGKLRVAFDRWRNNRQEMMVMQQMDMIEDCMDSNN